MKNYYEILEVSQNASLDIIKKVFKIQVKKYHPDVADDKMKAEEKIKELNEAYEVLSSEEKRKAYDNELNPYNLSLNEIVSLKEENISLKEKLARTNAEIERIININENGYGDNQNIPEETLSDNMTNNNDDYIKSLNLKYFIVDFIFRIIVVLILIGIGFYAIYLLTGINIISLILGI